MAFIYYTCIVILHAMHILLQSPFDSFISFPPQAYWTLGIVPVYWLVKSIITTVSYCTNYFNKHFRYLSKKVWLSRLGLAFLFMVWSHYRLVKKIIILAEFVVALFILDTTFLSEPRKTKSIVEHKESFHRAILVHLSNNTQIPSVLKNAGFEKTQLVFLQNFNKLEPDVYNGEVEEYKYMLKNAKCLKSICLSNKMFLSSKILTNFIGEHF